MFMPKHASSNQVTVAGNKIMTDGFNVEGSTYYNAKRNQDEIVSRVNAGEEFIKITDVEIEEFRIATNNSLARGDVIEVILFKKVLAYPGLIDHNDDGAVKARNGISDALYSEQDAATYYFLVE